MPAVQWLNTASDVLVSREPGDFHGCVLLASALGGDVTFYDGTSTASGHKILQVKGAQNVSKRIVFNPPLWCPRGLYVDVGSSVTEVLVLWEPAS